jgi:[ribosomal protein S5]-alanine N-acetyltransferase
MLQLSFNPFPLLTTQRLVLRRPQLSDDQETFLIRSDKHQNRYLGRPLAESINDARLFLQKLNEGIDKNEAIAWVITQKNDDRLMGSVCIWNINKDKGTAEIGFELASAHQGQGIMQEAIKPAIHYAFDTMNLNAIEGWVHKDNERSIKLMRKSGFKRDEETEQQHYGKDYFKDMEIYTLHPTATKLPADRQEPFSHYLRAI